jgi:SAM-dependent methyltransferase
MNAAPWDHQPATTDPTTANRADTAGIGPDRDRAEKRPGGLSVWATGQRPGPAQRGDHYPAAAHPMRMLPAIAATAIRALTEPGDLVFDPLCGAGTVLVEALHLGRGTLGIDIDPHWASAARQNLDHNRRRVGGHGHVITADATRLPDALPPDYREQMRGRVKLLLTGWPGGPPTHNQPATGANLTHQPPAKLATGMATLLRGALPLMAPDGHIVITGRTWREHGELIDLPALIADTLIHAGLTPIQHCVALLAGLRDDEVVTRASRYHRVTVARARATGARWHLPCTQDVIIAIPRPTHRPHRTATTTRPARLAITAPVTNPGTGSSSGASQ